MTRSPRRLALARLAPLLPLALVVAAPSAARADVPPDDMTPPSVAITAPKNGAVLEAPASFVVSVSATDIGTGVAKVELTVDGAAVGEPDTTTPYAFNVDELAAGSHTIEATATDMMGNSANASVTIEVQAAGESEATGETGGGGEPAPGCGCAQTEPRGGSWLAAGLLALALLRRRRRA